MKKTLLVLAFVSSVCFNNLNAEFAVSTHHVKRFFAGLAYGPIGLMLRGDKQVMQKIMQNSRPNDSRIITAGAFTQLALGALGMLKFHEYAGGKLQYLSYNKSYISDNIEWSFIRKMSHLYMVLSLLSTTITELCGAWHYNIPVHEINKSASSSSSRKK